MFVSQTKPSTHAEKNHLGLLLFQYKIKWVIWTPGEHTVVVMMDRNVSSVVLVFWRWYLCTQACLQSTFR